MESDNMNELEQHPIAKSITPPLSDVELNAYEQDILKNGQIDDIIMFEGKILDKYHMYRILLKNGITPRFKEFHMNGVASPQDFVMAKLQGRNLSISQKACIGAILLDLEKEESSQKLIERLKDLHSKRKGLSRKEYREKYGEAKRRLAVSPRCQRISKIVGVSSWTLTIARTIQINDPKLFNNVRLGLVSLNKAHNSLREKLTEDERNSNKRFMKSIEKPCEMSVEINDGQTKDKIVVPNCFESIAIIENFVAQMMANGWFLEHYVKGVHIKDKVQVRHYANFYGNNFPSQWGKFKESDYSFDYRTAVVRAGNDRVGVK